jgi:SAM-dependent methyltransferase
MTLAAMKKWTDEHSHHSRESFSVREKVHRKERNVMKTEPHPHPSPLPEGEGIFDDASPRSVRYVLDNAAPQTPARFSALGELYDSTTIRHLEGVGVQQGWRCWEIGAGPGSIARWMCGKVGSAGAVLATDIDTRFLEQCALSNLTVLRHDIVAGPMPNEKFDLIHTRLVLVHLPEREQVLDRMIAALKPGGWLVAEEFDSLSLLPAPDVYPGETALASLAALRKVMIDREVNPGFGRSLAGHLRARKMQSVFAEGRLLMIQGGSAGAELMKANLLQLRDAILASAMVTEARFTQDLASLDKEDFMAPSSIMWTVAGRRS